VEVLSPSVPCSSARGLCCAGLRGVKLRGAGVPPGRQLPGPIPVRVRHPEDATAAGVRGVPSAGVQDQAESCALSGSALRLL